MIFTNILSMLASFTSPVDIDTTPWSLLLALPLIAAIAVVYKATKLEEIKPASFIRESAILFGSIVAFMILAAIAIFIVMKLTIG